VAKLILPKMGEKKQYVKEVEDDGRCRRISRRGKKILRSSGKWRRRRRRGG
jgi:hypothetical protein